MGVEYERFLYPKGGTFTPSGAAIAKLVERLRKENWIADATSPDFARLRFVGKSAKLAAATGAYAVKAVENTFGDDLGARLAASTEPMPAPLGASWLDDPAREDLRLVWPVSCEGRAPVRYPLTRVPEGDVTYALELHRAYELVQPISDAIEPLPSECACGDDLAFEWDEDETVPPFGASSGIHMVCEACSRTFEPPKHTATLTNPFDGRTADVFGGAVYRFALKIDCGKCFARDPNLAFDADLVKLLEDEFGRTFIEAGSLY